MKETIAIYCIILISISLNDVVAQEWSPVNASWRYSQETIIPGDQAPMHFLESVGTVTKNDIQCKVLEWSRIVNGEKQSTAEVYSYENGDTVYFFNESVEDFEKTYIWGVGEGDVYEAEYEGKTLLIEVVSLDTVNINGEEIEVQSVETLNELEAEAVMWGRIFRGIGNEYWILPRRSLADPPTGGQLYCYQDSFKRLELSTNSCDFGVSTGELLSDHELVIYPNPSRGIVLIDAKGDIESITVVNSIGRTFTTKETTIELTESGLYLFEVKLKNKARQLRKVLITGY
jgi:hypothetical protein